MDIFTALAEPTRRTIIELLARSGPLSATEIYEQFPVSPQAVSQHLKVLRETQLVKRNCLEEEPGSLFNQFSSQSLTAIARSKVAWKQESMRPMIVWQNC
jgi:DNA-binding transcriptional ArsR family regulator